MSSIIDDGVADFLKELAHEFNIQFHLRDYSYCTHIRVIKNGTVTVQIVYDKVLHLYDYREGFKVCHFGINDPDAFDACRTLIKNASEEQW